ncbi:MAG TPA: metallophosphoesterase [Blastocatellia bacterium]|nr:metallophosphoesterase [Blastocatellia bacterium]
MRRVIHLSDLHFGRVDRELIGPLVEAVHGLRPDLVAVSGDLTQRARSAQFRQARAFLESLPGPQIIVPGNHDVPLHNVIARFASPLEKYRRYITDDLRPFHIDDEVALLGLNTARSLTIKSGRIKPEQIQWIREKLRDLRPDVIKIVVTHHPFEIPGGFPDRAAIEGARQAISSLTRCGAEIFLAGHLHISHVGQTALPLEIDGRRALIVQAGTAVSTRGRGEANSFNVMTIDHPQVIIERHEWEAERKAFVRTEAVKFDRAPDGWRRVSS